MNEKLAIIYRITNIITNATYIGQTTLRLEKRLSLHRSNAKRGCKDTICEAIRRYGAENFIIEKIDETFYRHRIIIEQYYIDKELEKNNVCYNMPTKNFKEIMSLATAESKNGMYGKNGENAINGQTVFMLDDNKNIVKEFKSVRLAIEYIGTKGHSQLMKACREGIKYKGYFWKKTYKSYV